MKNIIHEQFRVDFPTNFPPSLIRFFNNQSDITFSDIIYLQGEVNYTHIYLSNGKKETFAKSLKFFDNLLRNTHFVRVHRSFIINHLHFRGYDAELGKIMLTNNTKIFASRRKKMEFEQLLFNHVAFRIRENG
jgi:DNA-binding LytR/AlgR family response regulator